jgi:hypothetical protein
MPKLSIAAVRSTAIAFTLLFAGLASSCGGDESDLPDPGAPGAVAPGEGASALNPRACAAVARGGKVDICHTTDLDAELISALSVPVEACGTIHAEHADDFLADGNSGCVLAKKKCIADNKPCKPAQAGACCSLNCQLNNKGKHVCR